MAGRDRQYETPKKVFEKILCWIQDKNPDSKKLVENAVSHIESEVGWTLKPLERTCVELQYVKTLLKMWMRSSLETAFSHLNNETSDMSTAMSTVLDELDSIDSFEDISTKLIAKESQLWTWFGGGCQYFQLIVQQEELFKNTPRFALLLNQNFHKLKSCFIDKIFFRCRKDILNDVDGALFIKFISDLTDFLAKANEDKKLQDVLEAHILESNVNTNSRETDWQQWINILVEKILKTFPPAESDNESSAIPEWIQRFEFTAPPRKEWTSKLNLVIREIHKKLLLPETTIKMRTEHGRKIISINGVSIFVSKLMGKMRELKASNKDVQEIQIAGYSSVHIDCDLDNDIWHGINIGLVTDKLIVSANENQKIVWDVSGEHATAKSRRRLLNADESGGNVHIKCNQVIGAEQWTITSNGGNGSSGLKWSAEELQRVFSPIFPIDGNEKRKEEEKRGYKSPSIKQLYKKLEYTISEKYDGLVAPGITGLQEPLARSGALGDGSEIHFSLYENKKKKRHTLILCQGRKFGQGGYDGDIILELLDKDRGLPPVGMEVYQAMGTGGVVYKASVSDGKTGQANGDVGFIHNGDKDQQGNYIGFENDQKLEIKYYSKLEELQKDEVASYVEVSDGSRNQRYATIVSTFERYSNPSAKAMKKYGVIRHSLNRHFSKVNEWKQMQESLWKMFLSDIALEENELPNVDALVEEIQNNEAQFSDLVHQQLGEVKIGCTKPAPGIKGSPAGDSGVSQEESSKDRTLNKATMDNRQKFENFLKDNSNKFIPDTWKQMSEAMTTKSQKEIKVLEDRIIFILSYINDQRTLGKKVNITTKWKKNLKVDATKDGDLKSLAVFLYDFECAVQQLRKPIDKNFRLRDTQILAILMLLPNSEETAERKLAQVATGEGKSLIVAAVAIAVVRSWFVGKKATQKIDIITRNDLLALRDSNLSVADGGLRDLYKYFGVSVANNCSQSEDERTASYTAKVVYGQLAHFQRDYLLTKFYSRNICNSEELLYAIIDEVDSLLLDQGNNTLYLSHEIPGMETLESLYVFIWEKVRNQSVYKNNSKEQVKKSIKSDVLFDLYGVTTKEDLKYVHAPLDESERDALWNHLIEKKMIDSQGHLLITDASQITKEKVNCIPTELEGKDLNAKLVFYFRKIANRLRRIRIPSHLLTFVDRNLDTWLNSAFQALELRRDEDYVIDQDRTDTCPDLNPQVIIIDPDTGTDQTLSQWEGALHQFLQLKEGCKLTLQSLKAVYISNAEYLLKYHGLLGVSGTLGSKQEQIFLQNTFKCDLRHFPSAFPKLFQKRDPQILSTEEEWLDAIVTDSNAIIEAERSSIIFCKSIKVANVVHQRIKSSNPELSKTRRLHRYTRDYEKFAFESSELNIGHVIVATNLAGRGTDMKIGEQLRKNGGLHVCLTFFPDNERIEEQVMGRAARNGAPGSGILIVCKSISRERKTPDESDTQDWVSMSGMEKTRNAQEKQRIARLEKDFEDTIDQVKLFDNFSDYYTTLKNQLCEKKYRDQEVSAICGSVLDQWALWLDEMDDSSFDVKKYSYSTKFIPKFKIPEHNSTDYSQNDWMTPARLVVVAKYLAMTNTKSKHSTAANILEQLIQSKDNQFYAAAYYYRAFIFLKKGFERNQDEFIKIMRTCENVLSEQINMQTSIFSIVRATEKKTNQPDSFCAVDGYTQQKDNIVNLLQYFLGSVRSFLGTDCSIEDFEAAGRLPEKVKNFLEKNLNNFEKWIEGEIHKSSKVFQKKDDKNDELKNSTIPIEKVAEYFDLLLEGESKCIGHQLNNPRTIPRWNSSDEQIEESNWKTAIFRIANAYGVCASTLENAIKQAVEKKLSKEGIEKELKDQLETKFKKDNLIHCTRESFWEKLVDSEALFGNENFVVVDDYVVDSYKLNRVEAKKLDFIGKDYILYDPIDCNTIEKENKIIFSQDYVEDKLYGNREYNRSGDKFRFNKMAKIDVAKLKSVNLKLFGQLKDDDLRKVDISQAERKAIMCELQNQNIIDDAGNLSPNYDGQSFKYPNCPAYEDAVMRLVGTKLRAEIVRRHWLKSEDNANRLEVINLLPLTPYRYMLDDLIAAYVISGVRLKEMDEFVLKQKVNGITNIDVERDCILDFLKSRQAIYEATSLVKQETALDFIDGDIRKVKANTVERELGLFRLMGFDHVMYMKVHQKSRKQMVLTSLFSPFIIIGGAVSISAGAVLTIFSKILPFNVAKNLLLMGGLSDIIYVLTSSLSKHQISISGYAHQRIRSASGKINLADEGKALWKLLKSNKSDSQSYRPAVRLRVDAFHQRRVRDTHDETDQYEIVNALLKLKNMPTRTNEETDDQVH
ncbi:uncharacterized protein LOC130687829 [Daphnia carinata]|uniref:uncharacterized protein LOC130687829 n=1 Tax=Daphnia carinata TaxID=120202 RepID=UPI00257AD173|nr:uncharacterized protein LOC130687829 [Daphnia carinata]